MLWITAAGCVGDDATPPRDRDSAAARSSVEPPARGTTPKPSATNGPPKRLRIFGAGGVAVPITPGDRAVKAGVVSVKIGDTEVLAPISRVEQAAEGGAAAPVDDEPAARAARWWVGAGLAWRSVKGPGGGQWVALVPASSFDDQRRPPSMLVDSQPVALDWRPADRAMVDALLDAAPELSPLLTRATDSLMTSPEERWRAKLASGRALGIDEDAPIADPIVAALARHEEGLWLSALERVWRVDRALCLRLATRLRLVVDNADDAGWNAAALGERVPLWPADRAGLLALRERLTDPKSSDAAVTSAVNAMVTGQPAALAVVIDDAGTLAKDRTPLTALWAASMLAEPVAAGVRAAGSAGGEELARFEPMTARRLYLAQRRLSDEDGPGPLARAERRAASTELRVSVGEWAATRSAVTTLVKARPPGVNVGPMFLDWTMASVLDAGAERSGNAALRRADPEIDIAGRLYREPGEDRATGPAPAGRAGNVGVGRWTLYLECRRAGGPGAGDVVRIHLGPANAGEAGQAAAAAITLDIAESGALSIRTGRPADTDGAPTRQDAGRIRVAGGGAGSDRWSAWVPIPPAAISADGVLQIGLVRLAPSGDARRSAWPRPMLPWADEPGRIAVDLRTWAAGE